MAYAFASESSGSTSDIKRPKTAWGLFLDEYKKSRGNTGGIEKFNELQKAASVEWKNMSHEEKAPWMEREKINSDNYVQRRLELGTTAGPLPGPTKRKRSSSEPKGYRRAFQFFVNEHRQQNPLYWSLFTFNQAQRELSAAWNAIPVSEKQKWFMLETNQAQNQSKPEPIVAPRPSPVATASAFSSSDSSVSPHAAGFYSAAGMIPFGAPPPQPLYDYYAAPPQQHGDYSGAEGFHYNMPQYGGDSMGIAATNAMMGRRGENDMYQYEQAVSSSALANQVFSLSSRSFSDGEIQFPEKRRKVIANEGNPNRCDTSYSEGALVSPSGTGPSRVFHHPQNFSCIGGGNGLDANDFFSSNIDEIPTFDPIASGSFLDPEGSFRGPG